MLGIFLSSGEEVRGPNISIIELGELTPRFLHTTASSHWGKGAFAPPQSKTQTWVRGDPPNGAFLRSFSELGWAGGRWGCGLPGGRGMEGWLREGPPLTRSLWFHKIGHQLRNPTFQVSDHTIDHGVNGGGSRKRKLRQRALDDSPAAPALEAGWCSKSISPTPRRTPKIAASCLPQNSSETSPS